MTYPVKLNPDTPCDGVLQPSEGRLPHRKFEPKNRSRKPPTLHQVIVWMARWGGFLARRGDRDPSFKTLWRGMGVLHHLLDGAHLTAKT
ncbi:MAG: hypothetical protein LH647_01350 [Leptolyngbyaceae cyanobacterium CAN_BIN12]|nr:hypothetical protein [Leptolyngbyaceae cyanobacterium CAN_BIN12]